MVKGAGEGGGEGRMVREALTPKVESGSLIKETGYRS